MDGLGVVCPEPVSSNWQKIKTSHAILNMF